MSIGAAPAPPFTAILWHSDLPPAALSALPGLGITAGRVFGERSGFDAQAFQRELAPLRAAHLDVMVENVATDFYAAYHRFQGPNTPVNAAFLSLLDRVRAHRDDVGQWGRAPSLSDQQAMTAIELRLAAHARAMRGKPAVYVCLGDETGIGDLSAASDLDRSASSLRAWRGWLQQRYASLAALNARWSTHFSDWDAVQPTSTDAALSGRGSRAGWMEFKAWMDGAFADAISRGTRAVHSGDPAARSGLEGAQRPGWGGYDYAKLARAVDVMEIGEVGATTSIARGFAPGLTMLTTSGSDDGAEAQRLWRFVLLGGRGVVLWDPDHTIVHDDGTPGPRGIWLRGVLSGLHGPVGRALIAAHPSRDRVGVMYSQASFRLRWLLDRSADRARGLDWTRRDNDTDLADSPWRNALIDAVAALGHLGLNPTWLDADALDPASLSRLDVVLLPQAIVLDAPAIAALRAFVRRGGRLVADREAGEYDVLGRERRKAPLDGVTYVSRFDAHDLLGLIVPFATADAGVSIFHDDGALIALQRDVAGTPFEATLAIAGRSCPVSISVATPTLLKETAGRCPVTQ